ncbi:hypothetical protein N5D67_14005 [Comamonas aquatica]|uniref:hypothetical protein n=1 Tax=Comamonas aquatica TaxID=225991 RepID=UPI00244BAECA|nr:hypothetical protein [Comamonas aquatica]MDH1903413.1 hypothetical protein [Comamonas aquatica]
MSTDQVQAPAFVLPSLVQVIIAGPVLDKAYQDRKYKTQQLECIALDDTGQELQVGVIKVPTHLHGQISRGFYRPVFGMRVNRERVIEPVLIDLTPYKPAAAPASSSKSTAAAAA